MKIPGRLQHETPGWVANGSSFHIRMRGDAGVRFIADDDRGNVARTILEAARVYHDGQRWSCRLFLIMPDHVHAIAAFPGNSSMSDTIRSWKSFLSRAHGIRWQEGYFDHRLRNRKEEDQCWRYIRQNPVRAGLVSDEDAWPWVWSPENGSLSE